VFFRTGQHFFTFHNVSINIDTKNRTGDKFLRENRTGDKKNVDELLIFLRRPYMRAPV